jgi:choline dehydrogenase-like flavoprotein
MQVDTAAIAPGAVLRCRVCIVGAGAAGITIARSLAGEGMDVVLLEGGELKGTADSQALYKGKMVNRYRGKKDRKYLTTTRLRFFGGTTNHWNGWCRPLDPIDFRERSWVPDSGWPFDETELAPWYAKAADWVDIPRFTATPEDYRQQKRRPLDVGDRIVTKIFHYSPPTRFGTKYRQDLFDARDVRVLVGANAMAFRTNEAATHVERVDVKTFAGTRFTVEARRFVLACGGIENARLLLVSDHEQAGGLGNGNDLVGRYFADHPHGHRSGKLVFLDPKATRNRLALSMYGGSKPDPLAGGKRTRGVFCISDTTQEEEGTLQFSVQLKSFGKQKLNELDQAVIETGHALDQGRQGMKQSRLKAHASEVFVRAEQAPNPLSRVTLDTEVDALGMRRSRLNWVLNDLDRKTLDRSLQVFGEEMGISGLGRLRVTVDDERPWRQTRGGAHHIGTTRMHTDPKRGVCDADGKVHGIDNLWVGGSSLFPTVGFANPTYTLTALALRTADRLRTLHARDGADR